MGKTRTPMFSDKDKTLVSLKILGPQYLIHQSEPIVVRAKVNITWEKLLNEQLKLKVPLDQGIFIANWGHNRKRGSKWRSELAKPICHYVNQYSRNKDTYVACLRRPDIATIIKGHQTQSAPVPLKRLQTTGLSERFAMPPPPPPPPIYQRRPMATAAPPPFAIASTSRGIRRASVGSASVSSTGQGVPTPRNSVVAWGVPTIRDVRSLYPVESVERGDPADEWDPEEMELDGGDDQVSVITSASQQVEELRRSGIPMEDIRSSAQRQFERYGNTVLLRMRHEIQMLMRNELWMKVVERAPLNSYFLREVLGLMNN